MLPECQCRHRYRGEFLRPVLRLEQGVSPGVSDLDGNVIGTLITVDELQGPVETRPVVQRVLTPELCLTEGPDLVVDPGHPDPADGREEECPEPCHQEARYEDRQQRNLEAEH